MPFRKTLTPPGASMPTAEEAMELRRLTTLRHAKNEGLVGGEKDARISGRVSHVLLQAARRRAGLRSDTELLEYALARVALEDNFGEKLFRHEGKVPKDIDLEF